MRFVDDRIAGTQRERIDDVTATSWHLRAARRVLRPEKVRLGEQRQARHDEAAGQGSGRRGNQIPLWRLNQGRLVPGRNILSRKHFGDALRRAGPCRRDDHPAAGTDEFPQRGRDSGYVAVKFGGLPRDGIGAVTERRDRPPRDAGGVGAFPDLRELAVGSRFQVDGLRSPERRGGPRCRQELGAGTDQLARPDTHPFGIAHDDAGSGQELIEQRTERAAWMRIGQHRSERFDPLDGHPLGNFVENVREAGMVGNQIAGSLTDRVGQQEFATRRRPKTLRARRFLRNGALIRHREMADVFHLITEKLHPDGVFVGG